MPYTSSRYPLVLLPLLRLWSVSRVHGYVTPADFVRGRYGSPLLALLVALTGIVATMPYIALQLAGLEAVLRTMGLNGSGFWGHAPLFVAFVVLAAYTYQSGLRAPALIAVVKDLLIYIVIIVAIIYLPLKLGGWGPIFDARARRSSPSPPPPRAAGGLDPADGEQPAPVRHARARLALALFLYPHSVTGVLSSKSRGTIRRNMAALPAYSFLLALIALLGYVAIAAGVEADRQRLHRTRGLQHDRPGAVRHAVPAVVRGHRVRRHRDRRARAGGDHVDRRGEPVDPQHLQGVPAPRRHPARRGPPGQVRLAGRQGRRGAVHRRRRPAVRRSTSSSSAA